MPVRESGPAGSPCWVDLMTSDVERSRAFYTQLFGWEAEDANAEFGGYFNFTKDGVRVAGAYPAMPEAPVSDIWSVHLQTDDAQKTVEAAVAAGGQLLVTPMQVGDLGTMSVVLDPGGAAIGGWQPGAHRGFGVFGESNTPAWFELHTREYDKSLAFYRDVFHWDLATQGDTPEFRYTTMRSAPGSDEYLAGIMDASGFLPENAPSHWSVYFGVEDVHRALDRIVELGGVVILPPDDTPYGWLATAADPTGSAFKLVAPNDRMPARS